MQKLRIRARPHQNIIMNTGADIQVPNIDEALFSLQSISGTNMIDSINGWEFPIIDKDWEDTDYIGLYYLPWKTEAKISPPADGTPAATAIQAVDVNNFWYEAGGTAKQIPVQAFFNNIDFDNLTFCKHAERFTLDWGVETLPRGASYITMYDSAQTITGEFTSFFGSDVEPDAGAYFVTKSGNDTTGDGSQSLPYLTIQKAVDIIKAATGGGKIYIGSGIFDEDNGSGYLGFDDTDVTYTLVGIGDTTITSNGTTDIVYSKAAAVTFENIVLDGETNTGYAIEGFYNFAATEAYPDFKFNKTAVKGITTAFGNTAFYDITEMNDAVFTQYLQVNHNTRKTITVIGSLVNYFRVRKGGCSFTYNKFTYETFANPRHIYDFSAALTVNYNHFKCPGACIESDSLSSRQGDYTLEVKYNNFDPVHDPSGSKFKGVWCLDQDCVVDVQYNKLINDTSTSIFALGEYLFLAVNMGTTGNVSNNYIRSIAQGQQEYIRFLSGAATLLTCSNNYIHVDAEDGQTITTTEGVNVDIFNGSTFSYNRVIGCFENRGYAVSGGCHGMLVSNGKNFKVYGNYISHNPLGFVYKNKFMTNTEGGVWSNLFYNNTDHVYVRRSDSGFCYNNTFLWDSDMPASSTRSVFKADNQEVDGNTRNWKFTNNLCVYGGNQPNLTPLWFGEAANLVGFEADDNVFYNTDTNAFIYQVDTLTTYTQAQSITNGWAADIDNNDPNIVSIPDQAWASPVVDGTDLDDEYKPALGHETEWAGTVNGLTLPVIEETNNIKSIWIKGAYVEAQDHNLVFGVDNLVFGLDNLVYKNY